MRIDRVLLRRRSRVWRLSASCPRLHLYVVGPSGALVALSGVAGDTRGIERGDALADVSLRMAAEDLVVVVGPSGPRPDF